jgi:hypothetical protein
MAKTLEQKIADAELRKKQAQNDYDLLMAQYSEREKKARNERIYRRGDSIEKALPEIIPLTQRQFDKFIERALATDFTRRKIKEILAEAETPAEPKAVADATRTNASPIAKPAQTPNGGGAGANASGGNAAKPTSQPVGA